MGVIIRSNPDGENGVKVWLEFVPKDELKNFTRVEVAIRAGKKCLVSAPLLTVRPTPERVAVHFSSDAENLPASVLTIVVQEGERTRIGYFWIVSQTLEMSPRWDAVAWVVTQNMRDVIEGRYGLLPEVVSWFKSLAMFRQTERDLMILKEPTSDDCSFHKTVLALLIGEGERLRAAVEGAGGIEPSESGITLKEFEAALEHLYDTQAVWHAEMTPERKAEILQGVFHGQGAGT